MSTPSNEDAIVAVYRKLNELFGNKDGQLFVMEYPGRILDIGTYAYQGSSTDNAQDIKPQSIVESEFRLSDDLFNLGELTGGPNGSRLSQIYEEILTSLVPNGAEASSYEGKILPDQDRIAEWLIEDVPNWIPPPVDILSELLPEDTHKHIEKPRKEARDEGGRPLKKDSTPAAIPRIDLYQKLLDAYEEENFRWKQFMLNARPKDDNNAKAWDDYNRTIAIYGPVVEKKLEALWTTLVVRGQYHRVRHFIGLVDVGSSSESLLAAKSSLRESVMRSVDQTQDIYPVQFSPASWASFLTTDFEPIDLLMDPKLLRTRLIDLQSERRAMIAHKSLLESGQPSSDLIKQLQKDEQAVRSEYNTALANMTKGFTDITLKLAGIFFKGLPNLEDATKSENLSTFTGKLNTFLQKSGGLFNPVTTDDFSKLAKWQGDSVRMLKRLTEASEAYSRAMIQSAGAQASDASIAILQCSQRIESLTQAIEELTSVLGSASQGTNLTGLDDAGKDQEKEQETGQPADGKPLPPARVKKGASLWQTVIAEGRQSGSAASTKLTTSAEVSQSSANFLFGGYQRSSHSVSAGSDKASASYDLDLKIAFSVMKVTINRPWFNASILQNTKGFYRITAGKKISADTQWIELSRNGSVDDKRKAFAAAQNSSMLPAFPIAFLVVKDVSISIINTATENGASGEQIAKQISESGGFLCFSSSSSSQSESSSHTAYSKHAEKGVNLRMPGPQILGWFLQSVSEDQTNKDYTVFDEKTLPKPKKKDGN